MKIKRSNRGLKNKKNFFNLKNYNIKYLGLSLELLWTVWGSSFSDSSWSGLCFSRFLGPFLCSRC